MSARVPSPSALYDVLPMPADELPNVALLRGCPRSGTTWLAEIVNTSPEAAVMYEYSLGALARDLEPTLRYANWHRALRRKIVSTPPEISQNGAARNGHHNGRGDAYVNTRVAPLIVRFPTPERLNAIIAAVVGASVDKPALRVIGSKSAGRSGERDQTVLETLFPRISYLYTARSPLATINSMLNRRNLTRLGFDEFFIGDVDEAIREYRQFARMLVSHAAQHPQTCMVVKYEDLVAEFDATVRTVERFLGVQFDVLVHPNEYPDLVQMPAATRSVLNADENAAVLDAFGDVIASWDERVLTGLAPEVVGALADCVDTIEPGVKYSYDALNGERHFLGLGWSELEAKGVWSEALAADLIFRVPCDGDYAVCADVRCFLDGEMTSQAVSLELNGEEVFRALAVASDSELLASPNGIALFPGSTGRTIVIGPLRLRAGRVNRLVFRVGRITSPQELGVSTDERKLGIFLRSLLLLDAAAAPRPA
ncbi:MAG: sulfotransferase [Candidatus Eremiobacteraeota bacterium]|nr:sulfotransferase [Candidatus Eremiobacteraeota bacterium]